ncbi:META domain-containing protein [Helicobacter sp. MIT 05-5294]|uniref:META domain-containing protein n=1 Tax=Helicobacter sp. MIT 05-5294 TaxID=1548150 RepID=UPI000A86FACB|nr:META domain-containing protein [Helicobacter sp. MIT 05-5294]TLD86991.1 META domain-containing protein [Helicobacter sp. MIT 05-5294]
MKKEEALKKCLKIGVFCMVMSAAGFISGCAKSAITPNELGFEQCFNQETNTAKNCEEIDFKKILESKEEWKVSSYHYQGETKTLVREENPPILRFSNNQINGTFGCNNFFGSFRIEENFFTPDSVGMTRKMCEPRVMEQEDIITQNFLNAKTKILVVEEVKGMSKIFFIGKDFYLVLN